ncbi:uncharacterized protein LOC62_04G005906 [Vanrija pseudolonga]|uniref:F-box domain-containing protein n=1 Tax=Vanrija pseudolonga TaxID=143232 RepID=A0AAF0YF82_9TREE|nr:hypothetical protein LOC62_04G005906 [Vanrija pseudolonga]
MPSTAHHTFRLCDLPPELQAAVLDHVGALSQADLHTAARTCRGWNERLTPSLYASLEIHKANRRAVFAGLGLDFLSAPELESRVGEAGSEHAPSSNGASAYAAPEPPRKLAALAHAKRISLRDATAALALAEALLTYPALSGALDELALSSSLFRSLVSTGMAAFGRPRSGAAFLGETLVARLRPKVLRIEYPPPRATLSASIFDPVMLARVLAVLVSEWRPERVDFIGVGTDMPPVLGQLTRVFCLPCSAKKRNERVWGDNAGCSAHGGLVRWHLRRLFGPGAHEDLIEAIDEGADPTDEGDIHPDAVPCAAGARIEYWNVPCLAALDREVFLSDTFKSWPPECDIEGRIAFFP